MGTCHWASGGLVGGGDSSQKCPIGDVSLPPKELRVSRLPNERPWGSLGSQPLLPQKSKEEGPRISQISRHTRPPSTRWVYDVNQLWIQCSSRAGPRPHASSCSHPSLDTGTPGQNSAASLLVGNGMAGQAGLFSRGSLCLPLSQAAPTHLPLCPTCLGPRP